MRSVQLLEVINKVRDLAEVFQQNQEHLDLFLDECPPARTWDLPPCDPERAGQRLQRGLDYARFGDFGRAIAEFSAAMYFDPALVSAYRLRADAHLVQGDYALAVADYSAAMRLERLQGWRGTSASPSNNRNTGSVG